jgi:diguanylate cyclase (GGDEF)-like protein
MTTRPTYIRTGSVWAILVFAIAAELSAQRFTFRQYGSTEGLSNLAINCLLQDQTGYIWAGTDDGLFRYDGDRFEYFGHAEGVRNVEIRSLAESPEGVLWVATQDGLLRRSGKQFESVEIGEKGQIRAVSFDRLGRIYLEGLSGIVRGVPNAGSYRFNPIVQGDISSMFVDGDDVWFGKDGDFWRLIEDRLERIGSPAGLPPDRWGAIAKDSLGNLWVRSPTQLYELPQGQARFLDRSKGIAHAPDSHLYSDHHGRMYVSSTLGVIVLDGASQTNIDSSHGLPADVVGPVLVDREESLWLGTIGGGLVRRLGHGEWLSWKREDGLLHNSIWAIRRDRSGLTWVGTGGGLSLLAPNGKIVRSWTSRNGLAADRVLSIAQAPTGDFFVGTDPLGISHFNERGDLLKTYGAADGITERVNAIAVDRQRRLWAVGNGGCFRSRVPLRANAEIKFEHLDIPGIATRTFFRDVLVDDRGTVWIATSRGLARFDGSHWRVFTENDGLKSADLGAIAQRQGAIWLAYRDAFGMTRLEFNGERVVATHFTKQNGLSSDLIYALAFDSLGRLWSTTDNGVNLLEQGRWHNYGMEDGLIWNDGDSLALNVDDEGNVWVGTSGGLSRYTPMAHSASDSPPPVVLTSIEGGSRQWEASDQPALPYSRRSLLIRYAGLSYKPETRILFRYRLTGDENAWTETRERGVHFASLPAGHYVFEVVAAGPNGLWGAVPARFAFSIRTPWWRSWWFITCYMLAALLLGRLLWRHRVRLLVMQKEHLEQQVSDRTVELRESHRKLEEIAYFDMLTSLPNRRRFAEEFRTRLSLARRHGHPIALLLMDLDHFKHINDTFGHDAGDAVLIEAAVRMKLAVRESDLVARLGGDEFAILLIVPDGIKGVEAVCRRVVDSFSVGIAFGEASLKAGCSLGIALFPDDGDTHEGLYKSADLALYDAKRAGRNAFCWHRSTTENRTLLKSDVGNNHSSNISLG